MPILYLETLQCIYPHDDPSGHDEVDVIVDVDGQSCAYYSGQRSMAWGDIQELSTPGGIPFTDYALIRLTEEDPTREVNLGSVAINNHYPLPVGHQIKYLPPESFGAYHPLYLLIYHVEASEDDPLPLNRIELLSLKCNDAQGVDDTVSLYVNEVLKYGPIVMDTGQENDLRDVLTNPYPSADFRSSATVRLRETYGENWSRQFTIRYNGGDYQTHVPLTHRFHIRHSAADDATYTLTYRLDRRSVSDVAHEVFGNDRELGVYEYQIGVYDNPFD